MASHDFRKAFFEVCDDAMSSSDHYVSLYVRTPFYGGPEEGGWWGEDVSLVAYRRYSSAEAAALALSAVKLFADRESAASAREYGRHCLRQTEWLEARGLEDSYLSEPDGPVSYFVAVEDVPGSKEKRDSRVYS